MTCVDVFEDMESADGAFELHTEWNEAVLRWLFENPGENSRNNQVYCMVRLYAAGDDYRFMTYTREGFSDETRHDVGDSIESLVEGVNDAIANLGSRLERAEVLPLFYTVKHDEGMRALNEEEISDFELLYCIAGGAK